jgi:hypothetical protein
MELRFHISDGMKILQQKWVEYKEVIVSEKPGFVQYETVETGEIDWRDVPLVVEKTDDLAG